MTIMTKVNQFKSFSFNLREYFLGFKKKKNLVGSRGEKKKKKGREKGHTGGCDRSNTATDTAEKQRALSVHGSVARFHNQMQILLPFFPSAQVLCHLSLSLSLSG